MTITATSTRKSYVETGCSAAEVTWNVQEADSFRRLMIEALGRDCVCEPGGHCWLLESAIKVLKPRALEDGLVSAFAAVQKDANEGAATGGGPAASTVYEVATDHGLDGARVVGRVAAASR